MRDTIRVPYRSAAGDPKVDGKDVDMLTETLYHLVMPDTKQEAVHFLESQFLSDTYTLLIYVSESSRDNLEGTLSELKKTYDDFADIDIQWNRDWMLDLIAGKASKCDHIVTVRNIAMSSHALTQCRRLVEDSMWDFFTSSCSRPISKDVAVGQRVDIPVAPAQQTSSRSDRVKAEVEAANTFVATNDKPCDEIGEELKKIQALNNADAFEIAKYLRDVRRRDGRAASDVDIAVWMMQEKNVKCPDFIRALIKLYEHASANVRYRVTDTSEDGFHAFIPYSREAELRIVRPEDEGRSIAIKSYAAWPLTWQKQEKLSPTSTTDDTILKISKRLSAKIALGSELPPTLELTLYEWESLKLASEIVTRNLQVPVSTSVYSPKPVVAYEVVVDGAARALVEEANDSPLQQLANALGKETGKVANVDDEGFRVSMGLFKDMWVPHIVYRNQSDCMQNISIQKLADALIKCAPDALFDAKSYLGWKLLVQHISVTTTEAEQQKLVPAQQRALASTWVHDETARPEEYRDEKKSLWHTKLQEQLDKLTEAPSWNQAHTKPELKLDDDFFHTIGSDNIVTRKSRIVLHTKDGTEHVYKPVFDFSARANEWTHKLTELFGRNVYIGVLIAACVFSSVTWLVPLGFVVSLFNNLWRGLSGVKDEAVVSVMLCSVVARSARNPGKELQREWSSFVVRVVVSTLTRFVLNFFVIFPSVEWGIEVVQKIFKNLPDVDLRPDDFIQYATDEIQKLAFVPTHFTDPTENASVVFNAVALQLGLKTVDIATSQPTILDETMRTIEAQTNAANVSTAPNRTVERRPGASQSTPDT